MPESVVRDITAAVAEVAADLNRYLTGSSPSCGLPSRHTSRPPGVDVVADEVWAGNGSNEVLHLLQAFGAARPHRARVHPGLLDAPDHQRDPRHDLGRRPRAAQGTDAPFDLAAESAVAQVREHRPNVVFLCSPNNPTGTALSLEVVAAVYDAAPDAVVVVDEAYAEFAREGTPSALTLLEGRERLVVTRTMASGRRPAGRLGYLAAHPTLTDMRLVRLPYHLSTPTQAIALAALRHAPRCSRPSR